MALAELKTRTTAASAAAFIDGIADARQRRDCQAIDAMMREATGAPPVMWGAAIVGYGSYHYRYESGREADWMLTGFSPRKAATTLYIMAGFDRHAGLMARLGRYRTGKSCLYLKSLEDIDAGVLRELLAASVAHMRATWPTA